MGYDGSVGNGANCAGAASAATPAAGSDGRYHEAVERPRAVTGIATSRRAASDVCAGKLSAVGAGFGSCCPAVVRWRPQFAARVVGSRNTLDPLVSRLSTARIGCFGVAAT